MMANYTMEIREMINNPLINGVFTFDYPFYNDNVEDKKEFEELFLKYYYFREIGFETPSRFKVKLESKLKLIMPYYRQLAMTEWEKVRSVEQMMNSKDLTETTTHEQTLSGTSTNTGSSTSSINQSSEGTTTNTDTSSSTLSQTTNGDSNSTLSQTSKESRLENGVSSVSLSDGYLTGVSESTQTTTNTNSNESTQEGKSTSSTSLSNKNESTQEGTSTSSTSLSNNNESTQVGSTEEQATTNTNQTITNTTTFTSKGDIGIQTPAYAITEWRKVIININEQIIKECEDLFMKIY